MQEITAAPKRDNRRLKAFIGMLVVGTIVGLLLYYGQVAVIYILSTLSLIGLLLLVGFSDLEKVGTEEKISAPKEIEPGKFEPREVDVDIRAKTEVRRAKV